jgi:nucleoside-diphosphate-sugar epimerase
MNNHSKIYIAGHLGMVGSAIWRNLESKGYTNLIGRTLDELDLTRQADVEAFFKAEKPDYVFVAAAKVGGIVANNTYRAQFIYENLMIQNNLIHQSYLSGVKKLLFLGSSCIYPKNAPQPLKEEYLLTGLLEETNEPYAIAKIAGIKMCENYYRQYGCDFISVMPTNLYGPNDNYDLEKSHVLPALIRKMHLGKCLEQSNWDALRTDLERRPLKEMMEQESDGTIERRNDGTIERQNDSANKRKREGTKEGKNERMKKKQNDGAEERKGIAWQLTEEEIIKMLENYGIYADQSANKSNTNTADSSNNRSIAPSFDRSFVPSSNRPLVPSPNRPLVPSSPRSVVLKLWGSGNVFREFLHVNDMADACVHIMQNVSSEKLYGEMQQTHINIGTGIDLTIKELAEMVKLIVGFNGQVEWDTTNPDGTPKKQLDVNLLNQLNWNHKISLNNGIKDVYDKYCD